MVVARPLTVRGNAVIIDHGLGVFTGYYHQSKIAVQEGQTINKGDLIGYVGDTGLPMAPICIGKCVSPIGTSTRTSGPK